MIFKISTYFLLIVSFFSCTSSPDFGSPFSFTESDNGVEILEGNDPVLFYQKTCKSSNGEYSINNYIHPLFSLEGDTLTEEFPADHPHHRGLFWAWHQIYIGTQSIGDSWTMENITQDVESVQTSKNKFTSQIKTGVLWKSSIFQNGTPFLKENTLITVSKAKANYRLIDFEISLNPLVPDVHIGGSDNEKGYGGFSARINLPPNISFNSKEGLVTPQNLQIIVGGWMDFSGSFGNTKELSGLSIICHPSTPNYVAPWILRKHGSMQNIVFPGRERMKLSMTNPLILRYRLIVHKGNANEIDIAQLQSEYDNISYSDN